MEYYRSNWAFANLTTVEIGHAGGTVLDVTQVEVKVNGNDSVWGSSHDGTDDNSGSETRDEGYPVPDIRPALGSNEPVEFSSGQTWRFHSYNAIADERLTPQTCDLHYDNNANNDDPAHAYKHSGRCSDYGGNRINFDPLLQGDNANVVWTASSGGKTQTLFKYTVQ
jgi:hypothetical protein